MVIRDFFEHKGINVCFTQPHENLLIGHGNSY